jgi:hemerythrin superfamily protein
MNVYDLLQQDHATVEKLLQQLSQTHGDAEEARREAFQQLRTELERHTREEDEVFYARLEEVEETATLIEDARSDHEEVEDLLDEMDELDVADEAWLDRLGELAEAVRAHVQEEENEIFPAARQVLDDAEAQELGKRLMTHKRQHA